MFDSRSIYGQFDSFDSCSVRVWFGFDLRSTGFAFDLRLIRFRFVFVLGSRSVCVDSLSVRVRLAFGSHSLCIRFTFDLRSIRVRFAFDYSFGSRSIHVLICAATPTAWRMLPPRNNLPQLNTSASNKKRGH